MAILNVTPDSFSDGGALGTDESAVSFGRTCLRDGASILDVGGESTRPGAQAITDDEQVRRTRGVVRALSAEAAVSIDTRSSTVARAALEAGACIVNDVSACLDDPSMAATVAAHGANLVLMHRMVRPHEDRWSTEVDARRTAGDIVPAVVEWLGARVDAVVREGVARERIAVDPGLGFGKDVRQNLELLARIGELRSLGLPVVVGASRKSFLGAVAGIADPRDRDAVSAAAGALAAVQGAAVLRVHDVRRHRAAIVAAWSPKSATGS
ncbi:MAG: dihydropteroate synthase [Phycisphaerales bacterium]|nr:dihydropteroate synthase [Phycisphaerales bacterium]